MDEIRFEEVKEKGTDSYSRGGIAATFVDPYHNKIQNTLSKILRSSGQFRGIKVESRHVDVQATCDGDRLHFFEIKTDTPKNNIRQALGQLLEYSLFPDGKKADKLVVVGDAEPNEEIKRYLSHLRKTTRLEIYYRWVDMEKELLSPEF